MVNVAYLHSSNGFLTPNTFSLEDGVEQAKEIFSGVDLLAEVKRGGMWNGSLSDWLSVNVSGKSMEELEDWLGSEDWDGWWWSEHFGNMPGVPGKFPQL